MRGMTAPPGGAGGGGGAPGGPGGSEDVGPDDGVLAAVATLAGPAPATDPDVAAALDELVAGIPAAARRERLARRRHRNRRAAAVVGAVVALGTAAAGWGHFAHTGWFGVPGMTEHDTSEWIDLSAPDLREAVDGIVARDLPLPAGVTRADGVAYVSRPYDAQVTATGLRSQYEGWARCAWLTAWERADGRDDAAAAGRAADALEASAAWPATVATDGGGVVDHVREVARAAAAGEAGPVRDELRANCPAGEFGGVA
jgi:hypothetical protein